MSDVMNIHKIGIPRGLMYYREGLLWRKFFSGLGYEIVVSGKSSKQTLDLGTERAIDESCLPLKMYLGHVRSLIGRCDAIFVPRMGGYKKREKMCTRYEALPDLIRNIYRPEQIQVLSFSYDWYDETNELEVFMKFGVQTLGKDRKAVKQAYTEAKKHQDQIFKERQKRQNDILKSDAGMKVLLAGHSYVLHDAYIGADISRILENMGAQVLYTDYYDREDAVKRSFKVTGTMPWVVNREIMGASLLMKDKVDGIVLASAYPCGPDAIADEMLIRELNGVPVLQLTLDAQNGTAGLETRIESFMDIIQYQKAGGYAKVSS